MTSRTQQSQPWAAAGIWPLKQEKSESQLQDLGFKKGDTMIIDGGGGTFKPKDFEVEQESTEPPKPEQATKDVADETKKAESIKQDLKDLDEN